MAEQEADTGMVKALVVRAMGVGALAGLLAFIFARIFAEPVIQAAIDYESRRDDVKAALAIAAGHQPEPAGPDIFSRTIQANIGIGTGMILFGVAAGCFFGAAFCMAYGWTGRIRPRQLALLMAVAGFVTIYLVPFVKYPANPPSIGNPDTIKDRGGLYLIMVVASVVVAIAAVWLGRRLQARFGTWNATLLAGAAFIVVLGIVMAILPALGQLSENVAAYGPGLTETPAPLSDAAGKLVFPGFDADNLYRFRLYSVAAQLILWTTLGLGFAPLADRVFDRYGRPSQKEVAGTLA
jgi:Probable cobalt transporter subunit (CbtA)